MKLNDHDVTEFRRIYKACYGDELPQADARMWAIRLARLYRLLLRTPATAEQLAKFDSGATVEKSTATKLPVA